MDVGESFELLGEKWELNKIENDICTLVAIKDNKKMQLSKQDLSDLADWVFDT